MMPITHNSSISVTPLFRCLGLTIPPIGPCYLGTVTQVGFTWTSGLTGPGRIRTLGTTGCNYRYFRTPPSVPSVSLWQLFPPKANISEHNRTRLPPVPENHLRQVWETHQPSTIN